MIIRLAFDKDINISPLKGSYLYMQMYSYSPLPLPIGACKCEHTHNRWFSFPTSLCGVCMHSACAGMLS